MNVVGSVTTASDWLDKSAIRELIEAYFDSATRGDWSLFESLFASDARYEVVPPTGVAGVYEGNRSVSLGARQIRESSEAAVNQLEVFVQVPYGTIVTLLGSHHASARTLFHAVARQSNDTSYMHYAIYYDELIKAENCWRFQSRILQPIYYEVERLPGQAAIAREDLR